VRAYPQQARAGRLDLDGGTATGVQQAEHIPRLTRGAPVTFVLLVEPAAEPPVEIFAETGRERIFHGELVVPLSAGLALGSQEQGGERVLALEALGEAEPMGDAFLASPSAVSGYPGQARAVTTAMIAISAISM
jgi:hypothetical protein